MSKSYPKVFSEGKWRNAHRVEMERYLGRALDSNEVVHHCDRDIRNFNIENLELMYHPEHVSLHKVGNKHSTGENHPRRKLSRNDVLQVRNELAKGYKAKELAKRYKVHSTLIYQIRDKKIWREV